MEDTLERFCKRPTFKKVFNTRTELDNYSYRKPHHFVRFFWKKYLDYREDFKRKNGKFPNNKVPGYIYEVIIYWLLYRENIKIYSQDKYIEGGNKISDEKVYDVKPDILFRNKENSILVLSLKTSFRERWKQADWEAMRIQEEIKSNISCVLMGHDIDEIDALRRKINEIYLDEVVYSGSEELDRFIKRLKKSYI